MPMKILMTKKRVLILSISVLAIVVAAVSVALLSKGDKSSERVLNIGGRESAIEVDTYQLESGGWGYRIVIEGKPFIDQNRIPCVPGSEPFASDDDARKCGNLVAMKLMSKQMPSLKISDLDSLGISYRK